MLFKIGDDTKVAIHTEGVVTLWKDGAEHGIEFATLGDALAFSSEMAEVARWYLFDQTHDPAVIS